MIRILLVSRNSLFSSGITSLLTHQASVEIVGQAADSGQAIDCIKELQPDVVIVDGDSPTDDTAEIACAVFGAKRQVKVIGLDPKDNVIYIYRKEKRVIRVVEDLMEVIINHQSKEPEPSPHQPAVEQRNRQDKEDA
jgi:DNA-binding NarL/FixJ family response regulator